MIQVRRGLTRGMKDRTGGVLRSQYRTLPRHSVIVVSWATSEPNLGGITRTSEAFMVEHLYALRSPARTTAVGAHLWQPYTSGEALLPVVEQAKAAGYTIVALEQTDESISLTEAALPDRMCLLVGNEGNGVSPAALRLADYAVEIPQWGFTGSLNVVVATSIALYEWTRQHAHLQRAAA